MKKYLITGLLIVQILCSCSSSNTIHSKDFKTSQKRIAVLQELFNVKSEILDTEFMIFDVNLNSRSVPGSSSREYKVIVQIKPEDIEKWDQQDKVSSFSVDYTWAEELLRESDNKNIKLTGINSQYKMEYKEMVIFRETGVVVIKISQL